MKPFVIRNVDDDSILQLILPVRTYSLAEFAPNNRGFFVVK